MWIIKVALTVFLVALSVYSATQLVGAISGLEPQLKANPHKLTVFGVEPLDEINGDLAQFFIDFYCISPVHYAHLTFFLSALLVPLFYTTVHFDRHKMWFVGFYFFAEQYLGISIIFPLVIAHYLWAKKSGDAPLGLNGGRVLLSFIGASLVTILMPAFTSAATASRSIKDVITVIFLVAPCIPSTLFPIFGRPEATSVEESFKTGRVFKFMIVFFAGVSTLFHIQAVVSLFANYGYQAVFNGSVFTDLYFVNPAHNFMFIDTLSPLLSLAVMIWWDHGLISLLVVAILFVIASPGLAFALLWIRSELSLQVQRASEHQEKKKVKRN